MSPMVDVLRSAWICSLPGVGLLFSAPALVVSVGAAFSLGRRFNDWGGRRGADAGKKKDAHCSARRRVVAASASRRGSRRGGRGAGLDERRGGSSAASL